LLFRSVLFPNRNAPMATPIITIAITATTRLTGNDVVDCYKGEIGDDEMAEVLDVDVAADEPKFITTSSALW